jgi:hypothetical protein
LFGVNRRTQLQSAASGFDDGDRKRQYPALAFSCALVRTEEFTGCVPSYLQGYSILNNLGLQSSRQFPHSPDRGGGRRYLLNDGRAYLNLSALPGMLFCFHGLVLSFDWREGAS